MNLSEMLSRFGEVEEMADGFLVHCPSHADSHPSLRIGVSDKVLLKCRAGCQTGDVLKALELSWADLMTMHIDVAPRTRAVSTDAPASPAATAALAQQLDEYADAMTDEVRQYAMDRFGLTEAQVRTFGLGAWDDNGVMRLVVPFTEPSGKIVGHQARALDKNAKVRWKGPRTPADGGSWGKLGWFAGSDETGWTEVIITEGPGDALTAAGLGYDAIAVRGAALAKSDEVVRQVAQMVGSRKAVIAGDGDSAGREFATVLSKSLRRLDVQVATLVVPNDEDLTSWLENDPSGATIIRGVQESSQIVAPSATLQQDISEDDYPLTDTGAARWIRDYIRRSGSDVRFTPEAGFFLVEGGVWRKDDLDAVYAYAQEAFERMQTIAQGFLESALDEDNNQRIDAAKRRLRHALKYMNTLPMESAFRQLRALRDVATRFDQFDTKPHLLACRNGVVDLRSGTLMEHNPSFMLTRRININYNPEAKAERWEQFLVEVFPNHEDMPAFMQRLVGYGITGSTAEQCFAVHWGTGSNGKSIFTDTLTYVFRDITVTTPFSTFEARQGGIPNDVAALKGARLVMASEGEADKPMAEAMLKRLTGRDAISARFMRQEFFEFYPSFLLNLATNNKPRFKGQDEGLWRRVKLIPWERYFAPHERDQKLGDALHAEAEGILAWAVAGAVEWYENGLGDPQTVIDATKQYRENSDALDGFLPGVYEKTDDMADVVLAQDMYDAYLTWADDENLSQREIWTRRFFYTAIEERGFRKVKRASGRVFLGIKKV